MYVFCYRNKFSNKYIYVIVKKTYLWRKKSAYLGKLKPSDERNPIPGLSLQRPVGHQSLDKLAFLDKGKH